MAFLGYTFPTHHKYIFQCLPHSLTYLLLHELDMVAHLVVGPSSRWPLLSSISLEYIHCFLALVPFGCTGHRARCILDIGPCDGGYRLCIGSSSPCPSPRQASEMSVIINHLHHLLSIQIDSTPTPIITLIMFHSCYSPLESIPFLQLLVGR